MMMLTMTMLFLMMILISGTTKAGNGTLLDIAVGDLLAKPRRACVVKRAVN